MLNLKEAQDRDDINSYIYHQSSQLSRYDIDKKLLEWGFEPDLIEKGWQSNIGKSQSLKYFRRTRNTLIFLNFILVVWFFKPNIAWPFVWEDGNWFNQFLLIPLIVLLIPCIIIWYRKFGYEKYFIKPRYFLTVGPLILILLSLIPAIISDISIQGARNWETSDAKYKSYGYIDYNIMGSGSVLYKCDKFGLVCFEQESYKPGPRG